MRVFLLQDRLKGLGGKAAAELQPRARVGAGVMGGDIAAWSALRGLTVTLQDRERGAASSRRSSARSALFDKRLQGSAGERAAAAARLRADVAGTASPAPMS